MSPQQVFLVTSLLGLTTLLANAGLGWSKGAWWMWVLHALNAVAWQIYVMATGQWGLTLLNVVTIIVDIISGVRAYRHSRGNVRPHAMGLVYMGKYPDRYLYDKGFELILLRRIRFAISDDGLVVHLRPERDGELARELLRWPWPGKIFERYFDWRPSR